MEKLNFKQKIIIGILIAILVIGIGIYGFVTMQNEENSIDINDMIETENIEQNNSEQEEKIVVHITGEVNKAGVVILLKGARIADAIEAAGGITKEADLEQINLAYVLEDGQKIYIPNKKDKEANSEKVYITSESGNNVIMKDTITSKGENKKVNINQATQSELETLPGIGPSIASKIIEYRQQNGKFNTIEDLKNVKGIGDAKFENVKKYIVVK
ncbi:MAG: helix-hairpin-helix domain-containing protein [Clostridia bacterium]